MNHYPTLYKRTRTQAIQYWTISVEPDYGHAIIVKESGQLGTTYPLKHAETITAGVNIGKSNETTPREQAHLQAISDWKRKKDTGYKSLEDLHISEQGEGYKYHRIMSDNKCSVPFYGHIYDCLEEALPQFNTDAAGELLPQLAPSKAWAANGKTKYPQQMEIKYDGNRTTIVLDLNETYALSRTGKPQKNLDHLIKILDDTIPFSQRCETTILDGEVYLHGLLLEEINEAIKKENENTSKLQFVVYDLPLCDAVQSVRTAMVKRVVDNINSPFFQYSVPAIVNSDDEVIAFHDARVDEGYEGGIIKDLNGTYQPGQRSPFWKKVKMFEDNEFEIIGHLCGQRGAQDLKFICTCKDGEFEVTMNGTIPVKEKLFAEAETGALVGKKLTVKHFGYTKYGIPNLAKGKCIYYKN